MPTILLYQEPVGSVRHLSIPSNVRCSMQKISTLVRLVAGEEGLDSLEIGCYLRYSPQHPRDPVRIGTLTLKGHQDLQSLQQLCEFTRSSCLRLDCMLKDDVGQCVELQHISKLVSQ